MKNVKLICPIDFFVNSALKIIEEDQIENPPKINNEDDFLKIRNKISIWEEEVLSLFNSSFDDPNRFFNQRFKFRNAAFSRQVLSIDSKITYTEKAEKLLENFYNKKNFLFDFVKILPVLDTIINIPNPIIESEYGPSELFYLILSKLKKLKDGEFYPMDLILEGNGIELGNGTDELHEIIDELIKNGWIIENQKYRGRITLKGELFLEKQKKIVDKKQSIIVSKKIDLIINKLSELGLGQEILFDELEEMKNLYPKLNKKNWTQLVKGKLVELTLSKIIDSTVLDFVSKELLGKDAILKLLKS